MRLIKPVGEGGGGGSDGAWGEEVTNVPRAQKEAPPLLDPQSMRGLGTLSTLTPSKVYPPAPAGF